MNKKDGNNTALTQILAQLLASESPTRRKLPRGLHLAFTPPQEERPYRLVISRKGKYPSEAEDRTVVIALKDAFPRAFPGLTLVNLALDPQQYRYVDPEHRQRGWWGFTVFTWAAAKQLSLLEQGS